jgi:hypothetical protein
MWIPVVAIVGSALFLALGYWRPRFRQPVFRSGLVADVLHALVNGVLLDFPIAAALQWITTGAGQGSGMGALRLPANEPLCSRPQCSSSSAIWSSGSCTCSNITSRRCGGSIGFTTPPSSWTRSATLELTRSNAC